MKEGDSSLGRQKDSRERRSRDNKADEAWCSLPNGILLPSRDMDGTKALPTQPHLPALPAGLFPVPCPRFGAPGTVGSSSYPSILQGPYSEGTLPAQFRVTRVRRKRLAADSRDKGRKAVIQTTASLLSRARLGHSHHHVGIPRHHKNPHCSPKEKQSAPEGFPVPPSPSRAVTPTGIRQGCTPCLALGSG